MNNDKPFNVKPCPMCAAPCKPGDCYCKPCRAAYLRASRILKRHVYDHNANVKARRDAAKGAAIAAKGGGCQRCGWMPARPAQWIALHFHHPKRDRSWSDVGFGQRSAEVISAELERCELLCCRCHVLEHCEEPGNKPGRPRKPIDPLVQRWLDKLRAIDAAKS